MVYIIFLLKLCTSIHSFLYNCIEDNVKWENTKKLVLLRANILKPKDTMTHMLEISDLSHAYQNSINSQRNATTNCRKYKIIIRKSTFNIQLVQVERTSYVKHNHQ